MYALLTRRDLLSITTVVALVATSSVFSLPARGAVGRENFFSDKEQRFINRAWELNTTQIVLARDVEERAASVDVKAFAERMAAWHADFNDQLKGLASDYRGSVPHQLDADSQSVVDRVSALSGADFDREYMRATIDVLRQAVALYDGQSKDVAQTPTDKWAGGILPKLQQQLQRAERIGKEVGVPDNAAAITAGHNEPANGR